LLDFRLKAYRYWLTLPVPTWGHVHVPHIDFQAISYYADPLAKKPKNKEIDPELEKTFDKLGIPLEERLALSGTAVDAVMDSVSVKTTFKKQLSRERHHLLHVYRRGRQAASRPREVSISEVLCLIVIISLPH
jgi:Fe-S cluster assembly protein SufB